MSKLTISDSQGKRVGEFELDEALLVLERGQQALHESVVAHRAARRAGTASTKGKGDVAGSGIKPWKQKGTGRARAGYKQSPVWRGGGIAFGPKPRDYTKKVTRKSRQLAFRRAFSEKVAAGAVEMVDRIVLPEPKTRIFAEMLKKLKVGSKALFIVEEVDRALLLATRNLPGVRVSAAAQVSAYDLLRYPKVVVSRAGMEQLARRLQGGEGSGS